VSIALIGVLVKIIMDLVSSKITIKQFLFNLLSFISPIYFFYMILWGLAYHRLPLEKLMRLDSSKLAKNEVISLTNTLIDSANFYRKNISNTSIQNYTFDKVFDKAPLGFQRLSSQYSYLKYTVPSIKKASGSYLLAYMGTSGVYLFPTGEANVNTLNRIYDAPYTTSHEMAHQLGIASEDEANFVAYLACKNHPDTLFRYSAYYSTVFRFINRIGRYDSLAAKQLYNRLIPEVIGDRKNEIEVWKQFQNPFEKYIISNIYDLFLKSNGVEDGSNSYDRVIELMVSERRKLGVLKKTK
jgi:hypothetical protein